MNVKLVALNRAGKCVVCGRNLGVIIVANDRTVFCPPCFKTLFGLYEHIVGWNKPISASNPKNFGYDDEWTGEINFQLGVAEETIARVQAAIGFVPTPQWIEPEPIATAPKNECSTCGFDAGSCFCSQEVVASSN